MNLEQIMHQLETYGNPGIKKVLVNHGAREPFFGVKVEDLKKIQKQVKMDYLLSLQLYRTGNTDAMYLAGLISDPSRMTRDDLNQWVESAYWYMLSEFTVAWVASESRYAFEVAIKWIDSENENIASAGWATLGSLVAITPDSALDAKTYEGLLQRVVNTIQNEKNFVKRAMNAFVISVGGYCTHLHDAAWSAASKIGKVKVDMGQTACKIPLATEYIEKMKRRGTPGKKRKTAFC